MVVSRCLARYASLCSFHFGSSRLILMCSAMSSTGTSSPVMGDTTKLALDPSVLDGLL